MEDFVSFEIAKKLKEKGYPQHIAEDAYIIDNYGEEEYIIGDRLPIPLVPDYIDDVAAPTISQVLKWFREEKKIFMTINIVYCYEDDENPFPTNPKMEPILKGYYYGVWNLDNLNDRNGRSECFETFELAAIAGIEYVLDNFI